MLSQQMWWAGDVDRKIKVLLPFEYGIILRFKRDEAMNYKWNSKSNTKYKYTHILPYNRLHVLHWKYVLINDKLNLSEKQIEILFF